jgi:hypothetical protein
MMVSAFLMSSVVSSVSMVVRYLTDKVHQRAPAAVEVVFNGLVVVTKRGVK